MSGRSGGIAGIAFQGQGSDFPHALLAGSAVLSGIPFDLALIVDGKFEDLLRTPSRIGDQFQRRIAPEGARATVWIEGVEVATFEKLPSEGSRLALACLGFGSESRFNISYENVKVWTS